MSDENNKKNDSTPPDKPDGKKTPKKGKERSISKWFHDKKVQFSSEFKKIVWPSRQTLIKHTVTVIAVSLMFGAYIAVSDFIFSSAFQQFVQRFIASV